MPYHPPFRFAEGSDRLPTDPIFEAFADLTTRYPECLVGAAAMGNAGLHLPLEQFASAQLAGDRLTKLVRHTVRVHNEEVKERQVTRHFINHQRLRKLLPHVSNLGISSVVSSIAELARSDGGELLPEITPVAVGDETYTKAEAFLAHEPNAATVRSIFSITGQLLRNPEGPMNRLSEDYKDALFGQHHPGSTFFPPEDAERTATTDDKKRLLADYAHALLLPQFIDHPDAAQHGLSNHEIFTFLHNITRP